MFAAILMCGTSVLNSCKEAHAQEDNTAPKVESIELIRTSQSWDGVELPDYFQGRPELVAVKYVFPAGQKLGLTPPRSHELRCAGAGRTNHHRS